MLLVAGIATYLTTLLVLSGLILVIGSLSYIFITACEIASEGEEPLPPRTTHCINCGAKNFVKRRHCRKCDLSSDEAIVLCQNPYEPGGVTDFWR